MNHKHMNEYQDIQASEYAMKWYGWGSPIGLSIFFLTLVLIAAVIKVVFFT